MLYKHKVDKCALEAVKRLVRRPAMTEGNTNLNHSIQSKYTSRSSGVLYIYMSQQTITLKWYFNILKCFRNTCHS